MIRLPVVSGAISADEVREIFFLQLPEVVNSALIHCYLDEKELAGFVSAMEDADAIRRDLVARGLVSFVATGSSLNRKVGTDLPAGDTARLEVAPELENTVATPNFGALRGLTIPAGVTLVIGDNYSGRAELIAALAAGIYNHVPGDGRERVISVPDAVYVMADPGRSVQKVDISPFFVKNDDPALRQFTTTSATPAESLMAGVIEALHVGAQTLFFDESTAEPSFLAMDNGLSNLSEAWSGKMVSLSDRVRQIADELRVNVVVGACACSSEFIPVADTVLLIENYRVTDVTKKARELGLARSNRAARCDLPTPNEPVRWVIPSSLDPSLGREDAVIQTFGASRLQFGRTFIDLSSVPQIADDHQTMAIGLLLYHAKLHHLDDSRPVSAILDLLDQDLTQEGMDAITRDLRGDLARPRRFEVAAVLNRMSPLRIMARSDESGKK
jgi:predicted ABC-class ATPase